MSEIHYQSANGLMSLLYAREIGARELLDHFLDRVERHNPAINAIVWHDAERAREEADASDRRRAAGEHAGPLDGLPVTIKDSFDLTGSPTTWGVPEFQRQHRGHGLGRGREVPRRRRRGLRQDQCPVHAGGLAELQLDPRHLRQSVGPHPHARRLLGRIGGGARGGSDRAGRRLRYRRLDPQPGALLRGLRPQADLGDRLGPRPGAAGRPSAHRHCRRRPPRTLGGGPEAGPRPSGRCRRSRRSGLAADAAGAAQAKPAGLPRRCRAERPPGGGGAIVPGRHRRARPLARRAKARPSRWVRSPTSPPGRRWRSTRCCCAPRQPSG